MKQSVFPIWFRPHVVIPFLGLLWVVVPLFVWNFSPYALTHTTPEFLLGATDWGSGNIYSFTKIAYWIGLILGTIANLAVVADKTNLAASVLWRIRLNAWHILAASFIPGAVLSGGNATDSQDMWLLLGYLLSCSLVVLFLIALAQFKRWPKGLYGPILLLGAVGWGLVPVSVGRP
jgi:hypothetical protein